MYVHYASVKPKRTMLFRKPGSKDSNWEGVTVAWPRARMAGRWAGLPVLGGPCCPSQFPGGEGKAWRPTPAATPHPEELIFSYFPGNGHLSCARPVRKPWTAPQVTASEAHQSPLTVTKRVTRSHWRQLNLGGKQLTAQGFLIRQTRAGATGVRGTGRHARVTRDF